VFAFNPHESAFVSDLAGVIPLPDGISPEAAVFLPNMETAVNFVMDGCPMLGDQVAVIGQGIVGLLTTALLAQGPLASLVTIDRMALRREWSQKLGATASLDPDAVDEAKLHLRGDRPYSGADLTFELSGAPQALNLAISLTGFDGTVIIGSWYGQKRAEIDLGGTFHRSRIKLVSSQVSTINPEWQGRWSKDRRFGLAWEMLRKVTPEQLITHRIPFTQASDAYHILDQSPEDTVQVVLTYP
jgi:threonine dehydrogenase-like Zn-dependent dehydrogenase